jgi:predicted DNA-binding transcriptional regulator YafY
MTVSTKGELRSWILSFGEKAKVLAPADLRSAIALELQTALSRYEK